MVEGEGGVGVEVGVGGGVVRAAEGGVGVGGVRVRAEVGAVRVEGGGVQVRARAVAGGVRGAEEGGVELKGEGGGSLM